MGLDKLDVNEEFDPPTLDIVMLNVAELKPSLNMNIDDVVIDFKASVMDVPYGGNEYT